MNAQEPTGPTRPSALPRAELVRGPRLGLAWLLPLAVLALVAFLSLRTWAERGTPIEVELDVGHGLGPGDAVRYLGIEVGEVRALELAPGLDRVRARVVLDRHAASLARAGTRFWVARPQLGPGGVSGLDTLIGARYLGVDPGPADAAPAARFRALPSPPIEPAWRDGFEVVLEAPTRGGIAAGAPVLYRQFPVGQVVAVELSSDASVVEFGLSIDPRYADLVRERTRFWEAAGLELEFDLLSGLDLEFDSLESVLAGSLALAAPDEPGPRVPAGRRFPLESAPPEGWTAWRPDVPLGVAVLPEGALVPRAQRVTLSWRERGWFGDEDTLSGWALRVPAGLLGPSDLLAPPDDAREESVRLEVDGRSLPALGGRVEGALAVVPDDGPGAAWPAERARRAEAPEDVLVFGSLGGVPRALDAARLTPSGDGRFAIDTSLSIPRAWHGAPVLARADGLLLGLLIADAGTTAIAPVDPATLGGD